MVSLSRLPEAELRAAKSQEEKSSLYAKYLIERRSYDAFGNLSETRDKDGRLLARYSHRPDGRVESVMRPVSERGAFLDSFVYSYGSDGIVERSSYRKFIDAPFVSSAMRDSWLVASTGSTPKGQDLGRLLAHTAQKGGRTLWTEDALGNRTELKYDPQTGRLMSMFQDGEKLASFGYDRFGRPAETTDILGRTYKSVYGKSGKPESMTLPDGSKAEMEYDQTGRLVRREGAGAYPISFDYTPFGNLDSYTDANGSATKFEYDSAGRVTKRVWADGSTVEYRYDANGRLSLKIEASRFTSYDYDPMGRLIKVSVKQDSPSLKISSSTTTLDYDSHDHLVKVSDESGSVEFAYDEFARVVSEKGAVGVIESRYNSKGLLSEKICTLLGENPSFSTKYLYDELDRVVKVSSPAGDYEYSYDSKDRISSLKGPGYVEARSYDKAGRLISKKLNGKLLCAYEYDNMDRRVKAEVNGVKWEYSYDQYGQLVKATNSDGKKYDYSYDGIGNRLTGNEVLLAYNSLNQVATSGYTYDAWGNMTKSPEAEYNYDLHNRLTEVHKIDGTVVKYAYDPIGQRISSEETVAGGEFKRASFLMSRMVEYARDITSQSPMFHTLGLDVAQSLHKTGATGAVLASTEANGSFNYLYDGNGNVICSTGMSGDILSKLSYSPFGEQLSGDKLPFSFSTKFVDASGLSYYGLRFYSTILSRWVTRDSLQENGGINIYAFVLNNPIKRLDIKGLLSFTYHKSYIDEVNQIGGIGYYANGSGRIVENLIGENSFNVNYGEEAEYWDSTSWTYDPDWLMLAVIVNLTEEEKRCYEISIYSIETNIDGTGSTQTGNYNIVGYPSDPSGSSNVTDISASTPLDYFNIYHLSGFQGDYVYVRAFRLDQLGSPASVTFVVKNLSTGAILLRVTISLSR